MDATIASAPSMDLPTRQSRVVRRVGDAVELFLERQRDQLPLWLPVALGSGIAAWFVLPATNAWAAWLAVLSALAFAATLLPIGGRTRRVVLVASIVPAMGCALAWGRAVAVGAPVLGRPAVAQFEVVIERVEVQTAKARLRLTLAPADAALPPRVRVNVDSDKAPANLVAGERISLSARLIGPQTASVPGSFDFARVAWFQGLGATGSAMGPIVRVNPKLDTRPGLRERLSTHVRSKIEGSAGGIAAAFASGDRGGIDPLDEEAMRASGLTHLLSISGLHVTAVVGAAMLLTLKLLALSTRLALRLPLVVVSAAVGAAAGIAYTLLTGAEVPTVRSCIAAVLILIGIALGRQAFTLRLVATGAIAVLLLWPEALVGPSFQLSFAAITSIVALHEWLWMQRLVSARDEGWGAKTGRWVLSLLATGIAVEIALAPIALFHFHRQGLYGALANIVAIPLTTFLTMPLEALALLLDTVGLGAPFWWLTGLSLELLLWIARTVAAWPGAVATLPTVPTGAFGAMIGGALWLMLWSGRIRLLGIAPIAIGALWALLTPAPDLLVTGDGMHLAIRGDDGRLATLRPRAGDYVRSVLGERSGDLGELADLDELEGAECSIDACRVTVTRGGRSWRILATRSRYMLPYVPLTTECAAADIVISSRTLPAGCRPRWFKADRPMLARTGGLAVTLASGRVDSVSESQGRHPWIVARQASIAAQQPR